MNVNAKLTFKHLFKIRINIVIMLIQLRLTKLAIKAGNKLLEDLESDFDKYAMIEIKN